MATEIERKFLHKGEPPSFGGLQITQGMLKLDDPHVRVRLYGTQGFLTVKGKANGISRPEWEYEIPFADAVEMLALCTHVIRKTRHLVDFGGHLWEVDVFHGDNEGLVVAEIELASENEAFDLPPWVGEEVTHDPRYLNSCLSVTPFNSWVLVQ